MDLFSIVLINLGVIIVGVALGYLIAHFKYKSSRPLSADEALQLENDHDEAIQKISRLKERNNNLSQQLQDESREKKQAVTKANESEKQLASLNADYRNLKERMSEQKEEMQNLQERFKDEFENLANEILEKKSQKFTEHNQEKIGQMLKPLGEKMEAFKEKVEKTHKEDIEGRSSLKEHLKHLRQMNQQMAEEAKDLTRALKGDSKTQGNWGEVILQRILEKSGLTEGREYEIQEHHRTDDGRQLQPDVVVYLPDEKRLVVDSKVSLKAYEQYTSAVSEEEREQALKDHVKSIRSHVKRLGEKEYEQLHGGKSPDFVLMFLPIESAFGAALQYDSSLYYEAFDQNIVIVSPSTLLATLATIDSVWKQEYRSKNAQEIAERGGRLYDKFVNFTESMLKIGERIGQAQDEYDSALGQLSDGHGNLVRQVEMLRELGAKSSKKISNELSEQHNMTEGQQDLKIEEENENK